ncbi:substrate-binding periplasmic protein [Motiliproteus sediminis]|uniref:substrate-binding periplasmic protein n=1 Tax=Motiliproteus sediminis TaxID=1468178 RepID=UPI001AEFE6BB|nr:hypothetical protein [Motiliproteus sediminis]
MRGLLLALLIGWSLPAVALPKVVHLLSYHSHPPFVTGNGEGETYALAARLNAVAPPGVRVEVELLPRVRLNQRLSQWLDGRCPGSHCSDNWLVPWVNPKWGFVPGSGDPYFWVPLADDANVIVSRRESAVEYHGPESLDGRVLAGIRGHRYLGIDDRVAAGLVERVDSNVERDNLLMLLYKRVDAVLLPESTVRYFLSHDPVLREHADEFYIAAERHQSYRRSLMLPANRDDLLEWVKRAGLAAP